MTTFDYAPDSKRIKTNHEFINKLWAESGGAELRASLLEQKSLEDLRRVLAPLGFEFPSDVQLILVDVEGGLTRSFPEKIERDKRWYVMVLAPKPTRSEDPHYRDQIAWLEATFHATNDGYGM